MVAKPRVEPPTLPLNAFTKIRKNVTEDIVGGCLAKAVTAVASFASFARCFKLLAAKPQFHFNVNIA